MCIRLTVDYNHDNATIMYIYSYDGQLLSSVYVTPLHSTLIQDLVNLAKRDYCNAGFFFSVSVYMCVRNPISHHNFVKCGPILTKCHTELAGYDTCIVEKYHGNRSQVQVRDMIENYIS